MMDSSPIVYQIVPGEKGQVIEVLAAAFSEYPVFRYVLGEEKQAFGKKVRMLVDFFAEIRLQRGGPPLIVRDGERTGVAAALVDPPVSRPFTADLRRMLNGLRETVGREAMARMEAYENLCERMAPKEPHYYLGMIGVLPEHQGKGYARLLIEHIHEIVDQDPEKPGICLNTEELSNVPIYRHFGYEVIGEADVGSLHTWCMFRPSRISSQ